MLKILSRRINFLTPGVTKNSVKRFFLSNAYKCKETWEDRLKNPVFSKIDFENLYHDLDKAFQKKIRVNVLDVDLLANAVDDPNLFPNVEDVLMRLRLCPESVILPERTTHAVIRLYLESAPKEDLLNLLGDRIRFGVFPDYYLTNLLMDEFLKAGDSVSAVKIAVLQMLQEDFDHPIMKVLALHCCYNYLASPDVWLTYKEPEPDPDEDVKKVRVKWERPPYFDDHFDIKDTNHLVGKTLWLFGLNLGGSLGASSQLVGLVLYEKYNECAEFLEDTIKNNVRLYSEAIKMAKEFIVKKPKQGVEETTEEKVEAEAKPEDKVEDKSKEEMEDKPEEEGSNPIGDLNQSQKKILQLLEKIDKKNLINESILSETSKMVKKAVEENEKKDIELQCQIYKQWENDRAEHINKELKESQIRKLKAEISEVKKSLEEEEQRVFYFDKEEELQIQAEEKEKEMEAVVYYKPNRLDRKRERLQATQKVK